MRVEIRTIGDKLLSKFETDNKRKVYDLAYDFVQIQEEIKVHIDNDIYYLSIFEELDAKEFDKRFG